MQRFEDLLRDAAERSRDVRLVPMIDADGNVQFYAHIDGANSDTVDAKITGGSLRILDGVGATGIRGSRTADIAADIAHAF